MNRWIELVEQYRDVHGIHANAREKNIPERDTCYEIKELNGHLV